MINLAENYVMMVEPDKTGIKAEQPIQDNISDVMEKLLLKCSDSGTRYKGTHLTCCGMRSDNKHWVLPGGKITNSLAVYYLEYYRPYIPETEINKIKELAKEYLNINI